MPFQKGHTLNSGKNNPWYKKTGKDAFNYKHGKTLKDYFCIDCDKKVSTYTVKRCKPCSAKYVYRKYSILNNNWIGRKNPNWKGGKIKHTDGYIMLYRPEHSNSATNNYVFEHRLIIEKQIGRYLHIWEVCHHINKIRNDNRIKNLMAFKNQKSHRKFETGKNINSQDIVFDGRNWKNVIKIKK
jgi:hypothetical protein